MDIAFWVRCRKTQQMISTTPSDLKHDLCLVFFKSEVMARYRDSPSKYSVDDGSLKTKFDDPRKNWILASCYFTKNGIVYCYLHDLGCLPDEEQKYWQLHNLESCSENEKAIAIGRDFDCEFINTRKEDLSNVLKELQTTKIWKPKEPPIEQMLDEFFLPDIKEKKHYRDGFLLPLARLVIEGFHIDGLREWADKLQIEYEKDGKTLNLLEKCIAHSIGKEQAKQIIELLKNLQKEKSAKSSHGGAKVDLDTMIKDAEKILNETISSLIAIVKVINPKKNFVYAAYENIVDWFDEHRSKILFEKPYLDLAINYLKSGAKILDLGCGMGEPIAKYFVDKGYQLPGIDGSAKMVELAKKRLPQGSFLVGGVVIPDQSYDGVVLEVEAMKKRWMCEGEIKGSRLNELQAAEVVNILHKYDVLFCAVGTDSDLLESSIIKTHKNNHIGHILSNISPAHHLNVVNKIETIAGLINTISDQLYVQYMLMINLVEQIHQCSTLYYFQHLPAELGAFHWIIDNKQKDKTTEVERWWLDILRPSLAGSSLQREFKMLEWADYSIYNREYASNNGNTSINKVMEDLSFVDSADDVGLQLADVCTTIIRRGMDGNLQVDGWENVGKLMKILDGKLIPFYGFGVGHSFTKKVRYHHVIETLSKHAKPIISARKQ